MIQKGLQESVIPGAKFYDEWLAKSKQGLFGSKVCGENKSTTRYYEQYYCSNIV